MAVLKKLLRETDKDWIVRSNNQKNPTAFRNRNNARAYKRFLARAKGNPDPKMYRRRFYGIYIHEEEVR